MTIRRAPSLSGRILPIEAKRHISEEYTQGLHQTMKRLGDHHGNEHARYRDINPKLCERHECFAIIRNPWDRVVSRYWFAYKVIHVEKKVDSSYADVSSFENFLEERHKWGGKEYMWHRAVRGWFPQRDYVIDDTGRQRVACLRFEHLREDVKRFFGLPEFQDRARNVTAISKDSYMDMYDEKTRKIIADWYRQDIEHFGFEFDTSATRNVEYVTEGP